MNKPIASISLDLDNQWSYMKVHGDPGWETFPSYFDRFIPLAMKALDELNIKITFFIVGQDAALEKNADYLRELVRQGHELGNHSFHHESWLHTYTKEQLHDELALTEEHVQRVTGQRLKGFRGPGFSWCPLLLEVLQERGYTYDASTFPTFLGPLARMYYFWTADFSEEERELRKKLYGSFRDGLRPLKPYFWKISEEKRLLELPVTTIPVFRTPFHFSYLLFLSGYSPALMDLYLELAIRFCLLTNTQPSFLLHPIELISGEEVPELKFFPGMQISSARKLELFHRVMEKLGRHFELVNMSTHVSAAMQQGELKLMALN